MADIVEHLQHLRQATNELPKNVWTKIYDLFGQDEFVIGFYGTTLYATALYWVINIFFMTVDLLEWPGFIRRYKVQPKQSFKMADFWKAVVFVLYNQLVWGTVVCYFSFYVMKWRGSRVEPEHLPTFSRALLDLFVFLVVNEIGFYYSHRLIHTPMLYKHIHKKHHEWTAPIGIVASYCHPLEHVVSNLLPLIGGAWIMGSHYATYWVYVTLAVFTTIVHHSGYHLPLMPSPEFHDFHHLKFNNCYGVTGTLDWLHGTDNMFRKAKQFSRHKTFFTLTPPRELIPDGATATELLQTRKVQ